MILQGFIKPLAATQEGTQSVTTFQQKPFRIYWMSLIRMMLISKRSCSPLLRAIMYLQRLCWVHFRLEKRYPSGNAGGYGGSMMIKKAKKNI